jgi:hypothetical protein
MFLRGAVARSTRTTAYFTDMILPGNLVVSFTGREIRHADGRQLQRVGVQPDIAVKPTIAGIRAGRDEVLEAAIEYLRKPKVATRRSALVNARYHEARGREMLRRLSPIGLGAPSRL